jgi:hypothetical protein
MQLIIKFLPLHPSPSQPTEKLVVPKTFSLAKGRAWMPDLFSVSPLLR